jgi:glyoxylase-like metal-dependent hydrolase (beta-lactamase superfamily II)
MAVRDTWRTTVSEVATGVFRLKLPLGVHGISSVNGYLLRDEAGDTLVDCGIHAETGSDGAGAGADGQRDGTGAVAAALAACGSSFDRLSRLVITHAHIDHFGIAGEVVRRSDADLWMHAATDLDLAKYQDPDSAVDRRMLMLADHGLYGELLTEASSGLQDWMPVMPSIGRPTTRLHGGERFTAAGRGWQILHTPGHSPGHVCLWSAEDRLLCSGDHLLNSVSPPVTFERGFERDPMGSYLASLRLVQKLAPALVLPGHGDVFPDGAGRAQVIERGKQRRLDQVLDLIGARDTTVTELTAEVFRDQLSASQLHFVMAEILAYLAYHEARGHSERVRRADGVYVWRRPRPAAAMARGEAGMRQPAVEEDHR